METRGPYCFFTLRRDRGSFFFREMDRKTVKKSTCAEIRTNSVDSLTKSKREKQRIPMSIKKEIQSLSQQGHKRSEIMKKLNLSRLPRQTFFDIKKINFENEAVTRSYNSKHKRTDNQLMRNFETDVIELYNRKNKSGNFLHKLVKEACQETVQMEKYKDEPCLQKLKFSRTFCQRIIQNYALTSEQNSEPDVKIEIIEIN